jgi:hypothetical protein
MTVIIPLVGGPGHGQTVEAVPGPDGRPPETHLLIGDGGLGDAVAYVLETTGSTKDGTATWRYLFRAADGSQPSGDPDFASEHRSPTLAEQMNGGPEGQREDDSPKGYAGAD